MKALAVLRDVFTRHPILTGLTLGLIALFTLATFLVALTELLTRMR